MVIAMGVSPSFSSIRYKAPTPEGESAFGMDGARSCALARGLSANKAGPLRIIAEGGTMPIVNADGCAIYVEVDRPERAPALMLSNSLGTTLHMWDAQVAPFTRYFRLVRYAGAAMPAPVVAHEAKVTSKRRDVLA